MTPTLTEEGYTIGEAIEKVLAAYSNSPLLVAALSSLFFEAEKIKLEAVKREYYDQGYNAARIMFEQSKQAQGGE